MKKIFLLIGVLIAITTLALMARERNLLSDEQVEKELAACINSEDELNCWENGISEILNRKDGVAEAFSLLKKFREKEISFSSDCHVYAHLIGEVAYWDYAKNGKVVLDDASALCGYGFYHGFMQEFGHHGGETFLKKATKTCDYLTSQLNQRYTENSSFQCFHGIGHGLIFHYLEKAWPDEREMTRLSKESCRGMTEDKTRLTDCVYGVYGGVAALYFGTHGYKLTMRENPLWLCDYQEEIYKEGCYTGLVPPVWIDTGLDIQKTLAIFEKIPNWEYARASAQTVGHAASHKVLTEESYLNKAISACREVKRDLGIYCLRGLAEGIILYSLPKEGYSNAVNFCQSNGFSQDEVKECFRGVLEKVKVTEPERKDEVCALVNEGYKKYCNL